VRQPELPVILLEDAGALGGLVVALLGVGAAVVTGDGRFDAAGAMSVGTLLVVIAIFLAIEMTAMLVGESALPKQVAAIRKAPGGSGGVERVIHLRTMHAGPDELIVRPRSRCTILIRARKSHEILIESKRHCVPQCRGRNIFFLNQI
jgi:divalent metal cation (Fe/Co/Zn/Cd) transporter